MLGGIRNISYDADNGDSNYTVAQSIATGDVIARSWYDQDGDQVSAKLAVYLPYEAVTVTPQSFNDTKGDWMDDAVKYLRARGVAKGVSDKLFAPSNKITRAEFVTLLMRVIDWPANSQNTVTFKDDASIPAWAKDAVATAASLGIVQGNNLGNFNPNDTITRQDIFVLVYRASAVADLIQGTPSGAAPTFSDWDQTAKYAQDAIKDMVNLGLVNGYKDNTLKPTASATRGEAAQFLYNILEQDR